MLNIATLLLTLQFSAIFDSEKREALGHGPLVRDAAPKNLGQNLNKILPMSLTDVSIADVVQDSTRRINNKRLKVHANGTATLKSLNREYPKEVRRYILSTFKIEAKSREIYDRIEELCSSNGSKISLTAQTVVSSVMVAAKGNDKPDKVIDLKRYVIGFCLEKGCDEFTSLWKSMTNQIQNTYFESRVPDCPKLVRPSREADLLDKVFACSDSFNYWIASEPREEELWWIAHLCQSRMLPTPSYEKKKEKTLEFLQGITQKMDFTEEHLLGAYRVGDIVAKRVKKRLEKTKTRLPKETHLSLTGGSCWEASRSKGGKWSTLEEESEFTNYIRTSPHNLGYEYDDEFYFDALGNKVCSREDGNRELWSVAYLYEKRLPGELGDHIRVGDLLDDDLASGFDARIGKLLFLWANEKHSQWLREGCPNPKVKCFIVVEPGGKIRPVTCGETWVYLYLTPASHFVKDVLMTLPGAHVGLADTHHLYRFGQSYKRHFDDHEKHPEFISSSDLTSATDRADHNVTREMMRGFVRGLSLETGLTDYITSAISLNCSAREIHYECHSLVEAKRIKKSIPEATRTGKKSLIFISKRGNLMGEPLTKCFLTLSSLGAYYAVVQGFDSLEKVESVPINRLVSAGKKSFACAGDDHVALGDLGFVSRIPKMLESFGYEISWEKYRISRKYCHYCQDFGIAPAFNRGIKVDTIKLRLLNEFQKQGGSQFDSCDPMVGKMRELERSLKYIDNPEYSDFLNQICPYLIRAGMPSYFEKKVYMKGLCYLPSGLGGLGIPNTITEWTEAMHTLAYGFTAQKIDPTFCPSGKYKRVWERSMVKYSEIHNFSAQAGLDGVSSFEAFEQTRETLSVCSSVGPPSNSRVLRTMHRERVNIMEPQTLLGNKESPYAAVFRGSAKIQDVNAKMRSGPRLRELMNKAQAYKQMRRPLVYSVDPGIKIGFWVTREDLYSNLEVGFYIPSLYINIGFFEGVDGVYSPDIDSVAL